MNPNADVIILVGGLGTRLKTVIQDVPKPLAPINNRPFLFYILDQLSNQGFKKVVLALGYKGEMIESILGIQYKDLNLCYAYEHEPLGTGGAIKNALDYCTQKRVLVLNGDSYINANLSKFSQAIPKTSTVKMLIKKMYNFDRYGTVILNGTKVNQFKEKEFCKEGYINTGVYLLNNNKTLFETLPLKFSFEKEFLEKNNTIVAHKTHRKFIDIGVPSDYKKAQNFFKGIL